MRLLCLVLCIFFVSCATHTSIETEYETNINYVQNPPRQNPLKLTFAGDIMAHDVNFNMKDYSLIYEDIEHLLYADDLSFANFETPVVNSLPNESYPTFNVHSDYVLASIKGGFDVFSLANNHTTDQGLLGITETRDFFDTLRESGVYSAGIKRDNSLSYELIETQGWTVLFVAITELVNLREHLDTFDVYSLSEKRKQDLITDLTTLQNNHPHDIFVLSVHVSEPEYVSTVSDERKAWFHELLDVGVDIVWGNHPHVTQEWELIKSHSGDKLIMYSIGNTISGQNYYPNFDDPLHRYEDTGTSILLHVDVRNKTAGSTFVHSEVGDVVLDMSYNSTIIAAHKDEKNNMIIKKLTDEFIAGQHKQNKDYYSVRLQDMKEITGKTIWR